MVACQGLKNPQNSPTKVPASPLPIVQMDLPLVDLRQSIPEIAVELPYGTEGNITSTRLYPAAMPVLLDSDTAEKLKAAQRELAGHGLGLKIWDAYRPPEIQWVLWERSGKSGYVADPTLWWSKHCSGRAVDVTLIDLNTRQELAMPSKFDDFSTRAASDYKGRNKDVRTRVSQLQSAMQNAGFVGINMEWWHFANGTRYNRNIAPISAKDAGIDLSHLGDIKRF
jgi:D-alanyl-D-alanine dipeptidase